MLNRHFGRALLVLGVIPVLFSCGSSQTVQTATVPHHTPAIGPYVIAADDEVDVVVWKQPEVSGKVVVSEDGTITVPLAGRVQAAGFTSEQLQKELTDRLSGFIADPNVTVRVADARSQTIYVSGEVQKPGSFRLRPGEVLSQALAEAGGFTPFADLSKVHISRHTRDQTQQITVNFEKVQSGRDPSGDIVMIAGDVIHVP